MMADPLRLVQQGALERALVDDVDARRYFALAGTLDVARREGDRLDGTVVDHGGRPATIDVAVDHSDRPATTDVDDAADADDPSATILPAALLSLAAVSVHDDGARPASASTDPWLPGTDTTRTAVRRGARLALRWFDVPVEHVAARAGLPAVVLAASDG
jgi:hypothetical protein